MTNKGVDKANLKNERAELSKQETDHCQMQGAIFMFCSLLQQTDDTGLIHHMYIKIMEEGYDLDVFDGKRFLIRYMKEYSECNYVNLKNLCDKLIWVLKEENAENELTNLGLN
jgi:hypothetical protein